MAATKKAGTRKATGRPTNTDRINKLEEGIQTILAALGKAETNGEVEDEEAPASRVIGTKRSQRPTGVKPAVEPELADHVVPYRVQSRRGDISPTMLYLVCVLPDGVEEAAPSDELKEIIQSWECGECGNRAQFKPEYTIRDGRDKGKRLPPRYMGPISCIPEELLKGIGDISSVGLL